ncbi:TPA: hypothetical protein ACUNF5_004491 [Burkholderia orbicola]
MSDVRGTKVSQAFVDDMQADLRTFFESNSHRTTVDSEPAKECFVKRLYVRLLLKLIRPALQADRRERSIYLLDANVRIS